MKLKRAGTIVIGLATAAVLFGAGVIGYQDWQLRGSTPGNPASGYLRMWADNAAGKFKCITSAGAACYFDSSTAGIAAAGTVLLYESTASSSASIDVTTRNVTGQSGAIFQSDYDEYEIRPVNILPATNAAHIHMLMSTNGGSSYDTSTIYDNNCFFFYTAGSNVCGSFGVAQFYLAKAVNNGGTGANYGLVGTWTLFSPLSTTVYKMMMGKGFDYDNNNTAITEFVWSQAYKSTSAVNAFRVIASSGNITSGTIRVYGLSK